jgi:hypothetical protein
VAVLQRWEQALETAVHLEGGGGGEQQGENEEGPGKQQVVADDRETQLAGVVLGSTMRRASQRRAAWDSVR